MADTILVVDDNEINMKLIMLVMAGKGYDLVPAMDGLEALRLAESLHPKIVLLDIQLPGIDGMEVARRIRANPSIRDTVIIAVTAYATNGAKEQVLAAGCDGYISKPIAPMKFPSQVQEFVDQVAARPRRES
jgi:two-component system cell cycle response regulator DivK